MDPKAHAVSRREFNTPVREPWNPVIHHCLKAIDNHVQLYLRTHDEWHMTKAEELRLYVNELKTYIHRTERDQGL